MKERGREERQTPSAAHKNHAPSVERVTRGRSGYVRQEKEGRESDSPSFVCSVSSLRGHVCTRPPSTVRDEVEGLSVSSLSQWGGLAVNHGARRWAPRTGGPSGEEGYALDYVCVKLVPKNRPELEGCLFLNFLCVFRGGGGSFFFPLLLGLSHTFPPLLVCK